MNSAPPPYSDKLLAIDDEMLTLGRPVPPVVSWIRGKLAMDSGHKRNEPETCPCRWCTATRDWRARVEAWEDANPDAAVKWHQLREQYALQETLERKAKYDPDKWNYVWLKDIGCPELVVDAIQRPLRETSNMRAARAWMLDYDSWCLVLIGGTGCGKSVAAGWAAHQKLMRNYGVQWVDCPRQSEQPLYGMEANSRRHACREAPVLIVDDLGSGRRERESGPWLAWLDDVVGGRANNGKKTIITTNRTPAELTAWLGERLIDRLRAGTIQATAEPSMRGAP